MPHPTFFCMSVCVCLFVCLHHVLGQKFSIVKGVSHNDWSCVYLKKLFCVQIEIVWFFLFFFVSF